MARRQHTFTTAVSREDAAGNATTFDIVRQVVWHEVTPNRQLTVQWELGKIVDSAWVSSGLTGIKQYSDSAYDTLMAVETSAGQEDQIYLDLVSDAAIGAGTQGDYPS